MLRLLLMFAFIASWLLCTGAKKDIVQGAVATLTNGAALLKDVTDHTRIAVKGVEDRMKKIEEHMLEISGRISRLGIDATVLGQTSTTGYEALVKYDDMMKSLRSPERKLRPLMSKIKKESDQLLDILTGWDEHVKEGNGKNYTEMQVCSVGNFCTRVIATSTGPHKTLVNRF